jgi:hypothetical protein
MMPESDGQRDRNKYLIHCLQVLESDDYDAREYRPHVTRSSAEWIWGSPPPCQYRSYSCYTVVILLSHSCYTVAYCYHTPVTLLLPGHLPNGSEVLPPLADHRAGRQDTNTSHRHKIQTHSVPGHLPNGSEVLPPLADHRAGRVMADHNADLQQCDNSVTAV